MDTDTTNLVEGGDTSVQDTAAVDTEVETEGQLEAEQQFDDDGNPIEPEPPEDDSEEIEHEGQKYKVPKALKDSFLRQADYTRKTQEIAELRKATIAEREAIQQSTQAEIEARADIRALDRQIDQYSKIDWRAWSDQDPFAAQQGFMEFQAIKDQRGQAAQTLAQLSQQRTSEMQQETAKRLREGAEVLARDIQGWGPELGAKLIDFGVKTYGFSADEIRDFEDPRMVKVLHAAFQHAEASKTQKKVQNIQAAQKVVPAATVKAKTAPPTGLDDRLSHDEWLRRRNSQLAKRG